MRHQHQAAPVRALLETQLAKPWHYRRSGVYYLRVRPLGSMASCTLSLRTNDRSIAMLSSKQLLTTLRAFHLDNPDATWEALRAQLREIAESILATPTEWELMDSMGLVYSDLREDLHKLTVTRALTVPQAKAVTLGQQIMLAAEGRVTGDPRALVGLVEEMDREAALEAAGRAPVSLSVGTTQGQPPVTFSHLAGLYMVEQQTNVETSTMRDIRSSCASLAEALGTLDMHCHTRADLIQLREELLEDRKPSTVNKLVTRLSTVLEWAKDNGYLERHFAKNLKIGKGAESTRKAFSQAQVVAAMSHASSLEEGSWARWGLSLGAITGARIAEVRQLTKADIRQIGEVWVIDINKRDGKSLKNRHSARLVPIADGAYDFDLRAFLGFVEKLPDGAPLFGVGEGHFSQVLNGALRDVLGYAPGEDWSFHSLRHSLPSLLKSQGVAVGIAQAILGHSSQSITFDHYGGGERVGVEKLADALKMAFEGAVQ